MSKGERPFQPTEWQWFMLRLEVYSASVVNAEHFVRFTYGPPEKYESQLVCRLFSKHIDQIRELERAAQAQYYLAWVDAQKRVLSGILADTSGLATEFNVESDVVFEICYSYGMGAGTVCAIVGGAVEWR